MMKKFVTVLSLFSLFAAAPIRAAPSKGNVTDPYKFVWEADEGATGGLVRFFVDLNDDKIPDLFVGSKSLIGSGGGIFHIFLVSENHKYRALGKVEINPSALEILSAKNHGMHNLKTYWHLSASEGNLVTFVFDGREFKKSATKRIGAAACSKMISPNKMEWQESGKNLSWVP